MADAIEAFVCRPLSISLTRSSCAARHRTVQTKGSAGGPKLLSTVCVDCPVGAAHLAGERPAAWSDGALIEVRTLTAASAPSAMPAPSRRGWKVPKPAPPTPAPPTPPTPPSPEPQPKTEKEKTRMANPGAVHTWNGQSKTIKGWADEVGVTPAGVRARIKKGLNPDGSPRDEGAAKVAQRSTKRPQHTAPERVEQLATRVDVPAVLKALGLEVRMMEGTLDGWQLGAWRATPA